MERNLLDVTIVMTRIFARRWKSFAWRGAIGLSFGLMALLWPGMTLAVLVFLFGIYALCDGIAAVVLGSRDRARERSWAILLEGFAGMGLALAILLWTRMPTRLLVLFVAFWAITTGILELFAAIRLRRELPGEVLLDIAGTASVFLGFAVLFWPTAGVVVVLLGSYAVVFGAAMLIQAFRLRRAFKSFERGDQELGPRAHAP